MPICHDSRILLITNTLPLLLKVQKLELSSEAKEYWNTLLTHVREVTLIAAYEKAKKFAGIRKFAEMAARRRDVVAARKKAEAEQEAIELQAANSDGFRPKRALIDMLMAEVPVADFYAIEEFADSNMNFDRYVESLKLVFHRSFCTQALISIVAWGKTTFPCA